ncbi:MAG: DUF1365 family protein [Myxococcota bacterium]
MSESVHGNAGVSPTALYTGHVWYHYGLSHPAFATWRGQLMFRALQPANRLALAMGGSSLEAMLLARHRVIDHLLDSAIERGEIVQVVEIAAGLSPRGYRFARRHSRRGLLYIEGDLPGMCTRKRRILRAALRRPLGSRRVLALIHWQALKLWFKRATYRARPLPPNDEVSR